MQNNAIIYTTQEELFKEEGEFLKQNNKFKRRRKMQKTLFLAVIISLLF